MTDFTDDDVTAVRQVLIDNGADSDPGLHASWRCFDKVRYPEPCTCIDEAVSEVLAAVAESIYNRGKAERPPYSDEAIDKAYEQGRRDALREAADELERWDVSADALAVIGSVVSVLRARADTGGGNHPTLREQDAIRAERWSAEEGK